MTTVPQTTTTLATGMGNTMAEKGAIAYTAVYGLCSCGHLDSEHERDRQSAAWGTCYAIIAYAPDGTPITCGETPRCQETFRRPFGYNPFRWPEEFEAELNDPGLARRLRQR